MLSANIDNTASTEEMTKMKSYFDSLPSQQEIQEWIKKFMFHASC